MFSFVLRLFATCRSSDCFSLGWPMRDDGDFFKTTRDMVQVVGYQLTLLINVSPTFLIYPFCREDRHPIKNLKAQANQTLLRPDHFGTFLEVLIVFGLSIFWLYR